MAVRSANTVQDLAKSDASKDAARQCLLAADKYLKEGQFELARQQLERAKQLDPSNAYIQAFQDRIGYFEEKRKKEAQSRPPTAQAHPKVATPPTPATATSPQTEKARRAGPEPKGGESSEEEERLALDELTKREQAEREAAEQQRKRELQARTAAEAQRRRELEARVAAEEQRRRELEARLAADDEARREAEARALEERRRVDLEARALAEERLRQELEARVAEEERKRRELEERVARKELESRAAAEEQRRKALEARIAAEEQRRRELEARLAAEEQQRREEQARLEEERKRRELEERATEEERKRRELEARAAAEERKRKELEARAAAEEQRRMELEAKIAMEEQRRRDLEEKLAIEERRRREKEKGRRKDLEEPVAEEEHVETETRDRATEEEKIRELSARFARERQRAKDTEASVAARPPRQPIEEQEKISEMRRQIEELTLALEQEKKAREEITKRNLQNAVKQLRVALEAAWVNGAPVEKAADSLHELAISLSIPSEVEQSIIREVKLEMYSRAVKEVIAKRKLLRSSSSTLEWLRKVYQVSVAEYLENESKFLLDLVADQYKGTILLVSTTIGTKEDLTPRLKSAGYAVVQAATPENALEKIEKINPNLILCDTEFPESLSGVKFLHVIRANSKFSFIPFILMGRPEEVDHLKSSELKPNEGIIKRPVDYEELTTLINEKLAYFREYISALA